MIIDLILQLLHPHIPFSFLIFSQFQIKKKTIVFLMTFQLLYIYWY